MKEDRIGFVGVGVMGEPTCRNLAQKSGRRVMAYDRDSAPLERLKVAGVEAAESIAALARTCDSVFMALPSGAHVEALCMGEDGLLAQARGGQVIVDLGTSPVALTRSLAAEFTP